MPMGESSLENVLYQKKFNQNIMCAIFHILTPIEYIGIYRFFLNCISYLIILDFIGQYFN